MASQPARDFSARSFAAGSIAGALGFFIGHPLDTMKVHSQLNKPMPMSLRVLFAGCTAPVTTAGLMTSINLGVYENTRRQLTAASRETPPLWCEGVAGTAGGLSIALFTSPINRIKVLQQLQADGGKGFWATFRAAHRGGTLYSGFGMTALFEASRGIYMIAYALLKTSLERWEQQRQQQVDVVKHPRLPLWARSLAGAGANVIVWSVMYPVDLVRSLQQAAPADVRSKGPLELARSLVAEGGIKRLYRGYSATALRAGPVAGVVLPTFELVLPWLERI